MTRKQVRHGHGIHAAKMKKAIALWFLHERGQIVGTVDIRVLRGKVRYWEATVYTDDGAVLVRSTHSLMACADARALYWVCSGHGLEVIVCPSN